MRRAPHDRMCGLGVSGAGVTRRVQANRLEDEGKRRVMPSSQCAKTSAIPEAHNVNGCSLCHATFPTRARPVHRFSRPWPPCGWTSLSLRCPTAPSPSC